MPGRLTPGSVRMRSCAAATHAPVLPAEITTSASPLAASLHITAIELSGLLRIASTGESSISMTCVVVDDLDRATFCRRAEPAGGQACADDGFIADEEKLSSASRSGAASQQPLRMAAGGMVAAHHVHRSSHRSILRDLQLRVRSIGRRDLSIANRELPIALRRSCSICSASLGLT